MHTRNLTLSLNPIICLFLESEQFPFNNYHHSLKKTFLTTTTMMDFLPKNLFFYFNCNVEMIQKIINFRFKFINYVKQQPYNN